MFTSFRHAYLASISCINLRLRVLFWGPLGTSVKEKVSHHMESGKVYNGPV